MQCKKDVRFHLILIITPSSFIISINNRGWDQGFTFNRQNLLSVMKVDDDDDDDDDNELFLWHGCNPLFHTWPFIKIWL